MKVGETICGNIRAQIGDSGGSFIKTCLGVHAESDDENSNLTRLPPAENPRPDRG
jgi:hypothetical protein